jgi:pimeloyl-ACP methyl ester carboxylesterase
MDARNDVRSADGARIGYRTIGSGPGLVVLHGAMQSSASQRDLADLLATTGLSVHLVDRRGRGASDPYPTRFSTAVEIADLAAVLEATGARQAFGISSGALVVARAALSLLGLDRIGLFEPPLVMGDRRRLAMVAQHAAALDRGDVAGSMVLAMRAAEMGPGVMRAIPVPLMRAMTRRMLAADGRKDRQAGDATMTELAQALRQDLAIIAEQADGLADFRAIRAQTLVLDGTKSRPYLHDAVEALAATIPGARRVSIPGVDHGATQNRDEWGKPDLVAPVLAEFFAPVGAADVVVPRAALAAAGR